MTQTTRDRRGASLEHEQRTVLFISALDFWSMGLGKGGPALSQIVRGYVERGWRVVFVTGNDDEQGESIPQNNVHVIRFRISWFRRYMGYRKIGFFARMAWWLWFQVVALIKARKVRSMYNPSVIYGYEIHGVPAAKILSKRWGLPLVTRFQGTLAMSARFNKRLWRILFWNNLLAYRMPSDLVIMTNDGTQGDRVLERVGVDPNRVRFWMNGINRDQFGNLPSKEESRQELGITTRYVLLAVSRLVASKRVDRIIGALPEIVRDLPDIQLFLVGEGSERGNLESLAMRLGVSEHVKFVGATHHSDIPKYLAAADIFVSLYDWSNVGNPLLEAMVAGKCIITLNNGDTGRFIQNEQTGLLLEYEQLPNLPEIIKGLLEDENRREGLANNAGNFAKENFWTWDERIEAEISAVTSLIEQHEARKR